MGIFFYRKWVFVSKKKIPCNFSLVQTGGDWKLEFQSKIWNPAYL